MASTARLDELKKKFDENPRRYFAPLANEHRKSGDLDEAISLCRAHLPQQPAHISGHIVLGQALFEAGLLQYRFAAHDRLTVQSTDGSANRTGPGSSASSRSAATTARAGSCAARPADVDGGCWKWGITR